jgi:hypothetical protein
MLEDGILAYPILTSNVCRRAAFLKVKTPEEGVSRKAAARCLRFPEVAHRDFVSLKIVSNRAHRKAGLDCDGANGSTFFEIFPPEIGLHDLRRNSSSGAGRVLVQTNRETGLSKPASGRLVSYIVADRNLADGPFLLDVELKKTFNGRRGLLSVRWRRMRALPLFDEEPPDGMSVHAKASSDGQRVETLLGVETDQFSLSPGEGWLRTPFSQTD